MAKHRRVVNPIETGENIKRLMRLNHIDAFDIQAYLRMGNQTSIYRWTSGRTMPSVDSLLALADLFHCTIEDILIVEEADK